MAMAALFFDSPLALQGGDLDHQLLALGQELVERRIEGADRHGVAVHLLEEPGEVGPLHRQELLQSRRCSRR